MEFPTTLSDFQGLFSGRGVVLALPEVRWPEGLPCPHCKGAEHSYLEARRLFQCAAA